MGLITRGAIVAGSALLGGTYSLLHHRDELSSQNSNARSFLAGAAIGAAGGIGANLLFNRATGSLALSAGRGALSLGKQGIAKSATAITKENMYGAGMTAMGYLKRNVSSVASGFKNAGSVLKTGSGIERVTGALDQIGRGIWNAPVTKPLLIGSTAVKGALVGYGLYQGKNVLSEHSRQNAVTEFELNSGVPVIPNPTLHRRRSMPIRKARLTNFHNSTFGLTQGLHNARHRQ